MTGSRPPAPPSPNELLDIAIGEILEANSPYAYSTLTAVERFLRQLRLQHQFEAYEILTRAYLIGKQQVRQGAIITNPHAWLKRTAFDIVRQEQQRLAKSTPIPMGDLEAPSCGATQDLDKHLIALWQALITLAREEPKTVQLLAWRVLDGLSWQAIQHRLRSLGETPPSDVALRQQARHVKKHLRQVFHACQSGRQ